jgi:ligand-binding SRPBCC domain-containing protein
VATPRKEVFAFFADAANLEALTPGFLAFQIESPLPIEMRAGAIIEYRLKLHGVPIHWRTRIESFADGVGFIDVQEKGPYRVWRHQHRFRDIDGGTEITDHVDYELPLPPLGRIAHPFVKRSLRQIFDFRRDEVARRFGAR